LKETLVQIKAIEQSAENRPIYIHPGSSLWAERPELSTIAAETGMTLIAPSSKVLALFGNKLSLLAQASQLGIETLAISLDPMISLREIQSFVESGYQKLPMLFKSVWHRAGYGLCLIQHPEDLEKKLPLWLQQLRYNFGETVVFPERYLEGGRLITLAFARFQDGSLHTFPLVDASLQSRHRKIVEFCPAFSLDQELEKQIYHSAEKLLDSCGYVGVGTFDFLVDGSRSFLISGLARLNSAFHLWEKVAGTRAVSWQLAALENRTLSKAPKTSERAMPAGIAVRLYAEDPLLQLPQPGVVRECSDERQWMTEQTEAELDLALESGEEVKSSGDGFVGELYVFGQNQKKTLTLATGILGEIWIAGSLQTNARFVSELLQHSWVKEGVFHAGFVDEEFLPAMQPPREIVLAMVQICASHPKVIPKSGEGESESRRWSVSDFWIKSQSAPLQWIASEGPIFWEQNGLPGVSGRVQLSDGTRLRACAYPLAENKWQVRLGLWVMMVRSALVDSKVKKKAVPKIMSLVAGRVHAMLYREGAIVPAHETLLIMESLGMLVAHALPQEVRLTHWKVAPDQRVQTGQELAEFDRLTVDR
jgi:acetyl/propionyl-CoA carboxylase alpha subunit